MEEQNQAQNIVEAVYNDTQSPSVEQKAVSEVKTEVETPVQGDTEVKTEDSSLKEPPKEVKPVEKRIHKLVSERDMEKERADSLAKQVEELTNQLSGVGSNNNITEPTIEPGTEITPEQYQKDIALKADNIVRLRLEQQKMIDNINKESIESMKSHPELDPDSEVFDKELSKMVTDSVKAQVQVNPTASVKRLVDNLMKPYRNAVSKKLAEETEAITKQVSETALRPSSVKVEERKFEELSIEEMEKQLGKVY